MSDRRLDGIEEGEQNAKYFSDLSSNYKTKNCLVKQDGTVNRNQKEILKMQVDYYRKLYKADTSVSFSFKNQRTG